MEEYLIVLFLPVHTQVNNLKVKQLMVCHDTLRCRGAEVESNCCLSHQVRLEWPTDLAVNPMDNSLYVLENNVILRITENHQVSSPPPLRPVKRL